MNNYRINLNYAKALFMLATDLNQTKEVMDDMRLVYKVAKENHQLATVLNNPTMPGEKKLGIIEAIFKGKVCDTTLQFLLFVTKKRRTLNIKGIASTYMELYLDANNTVVADVMTAVEVNQEHLENIRQKVANYTGKKVEIYSHTTNKMLGSFHLTFGTYLYDARIRTKIAKMRTAFAKNDYDEKF